jgi:hypothetical protein
LEIKRHEAAPAAFDLASMTVERCRTTACLERDNASSASPLAGLLADDQRPAMAAYDTIARRCFAKRQAGARDRIHAEMQAEEIAILRKLESGL